MHEVHRSAARGGGARNKKGPDFLGAVCMNPNLYCNPSTGRSYFLPFFAGFFAVFFAAAFFVAFFID